MSEMSPTARRIWRGLKRHPFRIGVMSGAASFPLFLLEQKVLRPGTLRDTYGGFALSTLVNNAIPATILGYMYGAKKETQNLSRLQRIKNMITAHPYRLGLGATTAGGVLGGLATYAYLNHKNKRRRRR